MSLIMQTAREVVRLLKAGEVKKAEVLDALEARVAEVDGPINALPTLCFDRARGRIVGSEQYLTLSGGGAFGDITRKLALSAGKITLTMASGSEVSTATIF